MAWVAFPACPCPTGSPIEDASVVASLVAGVAAETLASFQKAHLTSTEPHAELVQRGGLQPGNEDCATPWQLASAWGEPVAAAGEPEPQAEC